MISLLFGYLFIFVWEEGGGEIVSSDPHRGGSTREYLRTVLVPTLYFVEHNWNSSCCLHTYRAILTLELTAEMSSQKEANCEAIVNV